MVHILPVVFIVGTVMQKFVSKNLSIWIIISEYNFLSSSFHGDKLAIIANPIGEEAIIVVSKPLTAIPKPIRTIFINNIFILGSLTALDDNVNS